MPTPSLWLLLRRIALCGAAMALLLAGVLGATVLLASVHDALARQGYWFGCLPHSHTCLYIAAGDISLWTGP